MTTPSEDRAALARRNTGDEPSPEVGARAVSSLTERMNYARALAGSDLLPRDYRGKPANVLLAVEYGQSLGVPPMTAIQGIHVIQGKPSMSADLMAGFVRRAGHKLRVHVERVNNDPVAVAELVRSDDPDYTYTCSWDMARANRIVDPKSGEKLTSKANWKNYPEAMLKARAISEVVREGASEVLHGVIYTSDELGADVIRAGVMSEAEVVDAEVVDDGPVTGVPKMPDDIADKAADVVAESVRPITDKQMKHLHALFNELDLTDRDLRLKYTSSVLERPVKTSKELTEEEASTVIDAAKADMEKANG